MELLSWKFKLREYISSTPIPSSKILIIAIDDKNLPYPFPRAKFAELIRRLRQAKAIGIDIIMSKPDVHDFYYGQNNDGVLANAMKANAKNTGNANIVLPSQLVGWENNLPTNTIEPIGCLSNEACSTGFINILPSGHASGIKLVIPKPTGGFYYSFPLVIMARYLNIDPAQIVIKKDKIEIDTMSIPINRNGLFGINYTLSSTDKWKPFGIGGKIPSISEILDNMDQFGDEVFRDKIILIGKTYPESKDFLETPLESMYGVEVYANIINTMLTQKFLRGSISLNLFLLILLLPFLFVFNLIFIHLKFRNSLIFFTGMIVITSLFNLYSFSIWGYLFPLLYPLVAICLSYVWINFYRFTIQEDKKMKIISINLRRIIYLSLILIIVGGVTKIEAKDQPLGIFIKIKEGRVTINGKEFKGTEEDIYDNSRLKTDSSAKIDLWLNDKPRVTVMPNSEVQVIFIKKTSEIKIEVIEGSISKTDILVTGMVAFLRGKFNSISKTHEILGGTKGIYEEEILLSPRWTNIITTQPRFEWRYIDGVINYQIMLYCGTQTVWNKEIKATPIPTDEKPQFISFTYPPTPELSLKEGEQYSWRIEMRGTDTPTRLSEKVNFVILGTETTEKVNEIVREICSIKPDDSSTHFRLGNIYEKEGLLVDAEQEYLEAIKLDPKIMYSVNFL